MRPEIAGFGPTSKEATQRVAVLLERRALSAMIQKVGSLGLCPGITRNDELLVATDAETDLSVLADEMAAAASQPLGFRVRVRAQLVYSWSMPRSNK